jgi:predicted RNA methylase
VAIRRFIPGYDAMLATAADAVAAVAPELVVDLGAGTGALSEALLQRPEINTVELLDVDPEMMEQSRHRLRHFADRVRFTLRSYYNRSLPVTLSPRHSRFTISRPSRPSRYCSAEYSPHCVRVAFSSTPT